MEVRAGSFIISRSSHRSGHGQIELRIDKRFASRQRVFDIPLLLSEIGLMSRRGKITDVSWRLVGYWKCWSMPRGVLTSTENEAGVRPTNTNIINIAIFEEPSCLTTQLDKSACGGSL